MALRPTHHWTDQKVKVQVFICVMALMLASLLQRELHRSGIKISLARMLTLLSGIRESVVVYPQPGGANPLLRTIVSSRSDEQKNLFEALHLARFQTS